MAGLSHRLYLSLPFSLSLDGWFMFYESIVIFFYILLCRCDWVLYRVIHIESEKYCNNSVRIPKCLWKFHFSIGKNYSTQNTVDWERRRDAVVNPCTFSYAQLCLSKDEEAVWWLKRRNWVRHNTLKYIFRKVWNAVSSDSYKLRFS